MTNAPDSSVPPRSEDARLVRARLSATRRFSAEVWRRYAETTAQTVVIIKDEAGAAVFEESVGDHPGCVVAWSPIDDELAYTDGSGERLEVRLARWSSEGFRSQRFSEDSHQLAGSDLAWAPKGDELLAVVLREEPRDPAAPIHVTRRLWRHEGVGVIDRRVGTLSRLFPGQMGQPIGASTPPVVLSHARWSPNGSKIAYMASFADGQSMEPRDAVHVWDRESGQIQELLGSDWGWVTNLAWSDTSDHVFFVGAPADAKNHFACPMSVWRLGMDGTLDDLEFPGAGSRLLSDTETSWPELASTLETAGGMLLFTREERGRTSVWWLDQKIPQRFGKLVSGVEVSVALLDASDHLGRTELLVMTSSLGREYVVHRETITGFNQHSSVSRPARDFRVSELDVHVTPAHTVHTFVALPSRGDGPFPAVLRWPRVK